MVISHDRAFCEAMRCSHVAYVANGRVALEERSLRPSDFSEADRGVANVAADAAGNPNPNPSPSPSPGPSPNPNPNHFS